MASNNEEKLLAEMKELFSDFSCSAQDLKNPTEEFVTSFFTYWLQEFEVDVSNVLQVQFSQTAVVSSYLDAYSGAIPMTNLLSCIRAFNIIQDFGILDIISPKPKRTQSIVKSFINFYKWSDFRASCVREKRKLLTDRKDKRAELIKLREDLKERLNNIIKAIAQNQDTKLQLEEEIVILQQKSSELKKVKDVIKLQTEELNNSLKEKECIIQKMNKEDLQVANKIKTLSNLVIDSPTTIISDLEALRIKHKEMEELSNQKRDMVESKMQSQKKLQDQLEDQQQRALHLDELLKLIDQFRELLQIVSAAEKNVNNLQENLKGSKTSLAALNNKKRTRQEALQSVLSKWGSVKPQLTESVETAAREYNEKKKLKKKVMSNLKQDANIQEKIDSTLKMIKAHIDNFLSDYELYQKMEREQYEITKSNVDAIVKNKHNLYEKTMTNVDTTVKTAKEESDQYEITELNVHVVVKNEINNASPNKKKQ